MELIRCCINGQSHKAIEIIKDITSENPIDLNFKDEYGYTALMSASYHGHNEIVALLLPKCSEATINIQNRCGDTALILASIYGRTEIVASLLAKCSESTINIQDNYGNTALILASKNCRTQTIDLLLTKCSETTINIQDKCGFTALILASWNGKAKTVKKLIYLSDIHIKKNQNKTAFDLSDSKKITRLFDLNTGCDTSLRFGKSISNVTLASLHSLKSNRWLNLF